VRWGGGFCRCVARSVCDINRTDISVCGVVRRVHLIHAIKHATSDFGVVPCQILLTDYIHFDKKWKVRNRILKESFYSRRIPYCRIVCTVVYAVFSQIFSLIIFIVVYSKFSFHIY